MKTPFLLSLAMALVSCRSGDPSASAPAAYRPLATAKSPCGRYELLLDVASWKTDTASRPRLSLQFSFRSEGKDVFPCRPARVTDLVPPDGAEFREEGLKGFAGVDGRSGTLAFHDLEVYAPSDHLRRLRVEVRVLRVISWKEYPIACAAAGAEEEFVCPPYHLGVSGAADQCSVAAYCTEDRLSFPAPVRDLFEILGHDWVATGAGLEDAAGHPLTCSGAAGSGGHTVAFYRPPMDTTPLPVSYPVRGILRIPDRYAVEVVPFEFTDVPLLR